MLNGSKVFITNGWMADLVIVVAITDKTAKSNAHGISLFLVDGDAPGFVKGKKLKKMGLKAQVRGVEEIIGLERKSCPIENSIYLTNKNNIYIEKCMQNIAVKKCLV